MQPTLSLLLVSHDTNQTSCLKALLDSCLVLGVDRVYVSQSIKALVEPFIDGLQVFDLDTNQSMQSFLKQHNACDRFLLLTNFGTNLYPLDALCELDHAKTQGRVGLLMSEEQHGIKLRQNYSLDRTSTKVQTDGLADQDFFKYAGAWAFEGLWLTSLLSDEVTWDDWQKLFELKLYDNFMAVPLAGRNQVRLDNQAPRPALFLDRDGIVIYDKHYPYKTEDLILIPEIVPMIKLAKEKNWFVFVISNQSGVAKGKFDLNDLKHATNFIKGLLEEHSCHVDDWFYCPYHEQGSVSAYRRASIQRKPQAGMILKAMEAYPIDLERSIMIGDKDSDRIFLPYLKAAIIKGQYPLDETQQVFRNHEHCLEHLKNYISTLPENT